MCPNPVESLKPFEHVPRLRLKPDAPHSGYIDGAWWPRGDDLAAEIPGLVALLSERLGPVDRVLYEVSDWSKAPAKISVAGHPVHLDGYRLQPPNTAEVLGLSGGRIVLLFWSFRRTPTRTAPTPR